MLPASYVKAATSYQFTALVRVMSISVSFTLHRTSFANKLAFTQQCYRYCSTAPPVPRLTLSALSTTSGRSGTLTSGSNMAM